jgi:arginyl-tRNA synthetase
MALMKRQILADLLTAVQKLKLSDFREEIGKIEIEYPDAALGDYSTNAALVLAKVAKTSPKQLAEQIVEKLDKSKFAKIEVAGPGFINFKLSDEAVVASLTKEVEKQLPEVDDLILVEYFQPNIAKPLHIGHLRTAIIGDSIKRMLMYLGRKVESDTHMGDWGTQFGLLILAYRKYGNAEDVAKDPITKLNEYYIKINQDAESDPSVHEAGKQEFVKLEQGDEESRNVWKQFVDWSMEKFLAINDLMDILPFDHHWPESFFEDKMPEILEELKSKGLLVESQVAQIVNLEDQGLGIAVIVKSDGGTTYLLRDLATFQFRKKEGFAKQLYVVDNRQSHHYRQLFAILKMLGEMQEGEGSHVDYGFISFKGEALSTRKGNMVLAHEVIAQAEQKVAEIIEQKNPELANKGQVIKAVAKGALKYYDLSHNRRSDYEFDWDEALDFQGNSGPYLQYTYARLSSVLRKVGEVPMAPVFEMSPTEHQLAVETTKIADMVEASVQDYLPNVLANYLYGLANLANRFYHESPVASETDETKKALRVALIKKTRSVLAEGLGLLGISVLEEM